MRGKKLLATLAVSAVLFAGCGLKSNEAIITVNDQKITQGQFDKMFDKQSNTGMLKLFKIDLKDPKNHFMYYLIKERIVNELIIKSLLNQEMDKRGIKVTNDELDEAVKEIIEKVGSKEQVNSILQQNGVSNAEFKENLKQEVRMRKLAKELGSSNISEEEAKKFYKENIDKFKHPDRVRASHILISTNKNEIEEILKSDPANKDWTQEEIDVKVAEELKAKEAKAKQLLAEAKKDMTQFAKLAKENSEDTTTAVKGGDLGFFTKEEMVPEFSKAAFAQKPNTISNSLVKSQYGYHIIMVTDRAAASTDPFEKVEENIKSYLENQKQIELIDKLTESLKKDAKIEYIDPQYDPEQIKKDSQEAMKNEEEATKKAQEESKKEDTEKTDKK